MYASRKKIINFSCVRPNLGCGVTEFSKTVVCELGLKPRPAGGLNNNIAVRQEENPKVVLEKPMAVIGVPGN